jgi:hypothetical protein
MMTQGCKVCLAKHDEEIHAATNRVHGWFRAEVMKHLHDAVDDPKRGKRAWGAPAQRRLKVVRMKGLEPSRSCPH